MIPAFKNPALSRAIGGSVAGILGVMAFYAFFAVGALPTDENIFITTPSYIMVENPLSSAKEAGSGHAESLQRGDLVLSVNGSPVRTLEALNNALANSRDDSVSLKLFRQHSARNASVHVARKDIELGALRVIPPVVIVTDITPGGASDRAGMQVGDYIVAINGQGFANAQEADLILRRGKSGASTAYEILRGGKSMQLQVTLARFGFPLFFLVFFMTGLAYMAIGTFLLMKRPTVPAALTLGYWFLLIGFVLTVVVMRREPDPTWFTGLRDGLTVLCAYLGIASAFHSHYIFPFDRLQPWHRRWLIPVSYGVALLSPLLLLTGDFTVPWMLIIVFLVAQIIATIVDPKPLTVQQKKMVLPLRTTGIATGVGSVTLVIVLGLTGLGQLAGFIVILILLIPLSHLYVIGRYRVMDLDLRIRRNVQYTVVSWLWGILVAGLLIRVFLALPGVALQVPGIAVTGLSVEIDSTPASEANRVFLERLVMMVAGAAIWFVLWFLQRAGQHVIARRYDQTQFDYRRAASELADVLSTKLTMNDIAQGVTASLVDLLKLKSAGLLVFRDEVSCCCSAAVGVDQEAWQGVTDAVDRRFADSVKAHAGPFRSEELSDELRPRILGLQMQSTVPIRSKDRLVGVLLVGEKLSESPHSAEDHAFLTGVSKQVSMAIDNAFLYEDLAEQERLRHELELARRIQLSSLPAVTPDFPGLDIAGISAPALEVGGDFFDYLDGDGRGLTVVVGDVSGKGTSAALYMAKVQGILRSLHGFDLGPRDLFLRANRLLCRDLEKSSFVTALGAHFAPSQASAVLVRAGHLPLFIFRSAAGTLDRIVPRGLGLGLNDAGVFASELEERSVPFASGDLLVFLTDGVVEARDGNGVEYGEERLADVVGGLAGKSAADIRDGLLRDVQAFGGSADQHDDQTIVVVRAL